MRSKSKSEAESLIASLQAQLREQGHASTGVKGVDIDKELDSSKRHVKRLLAKTEIHPPLGYVVDLGSGTGQKALALGPMAAAVVGVEPQPEEHAISEIKKDYFQLENVTFVLAGAEDVPLDSEVADLIISETVLEHVDSVEQSIRETRRLLKPGGTFYLACPNYFWIYEGHYHMYMVPLMPKWIFRIILKLKGRGPELWDTINYVTPRRVMRLLKKNGLEIKRNLSEELLHQILVQGNLSLIPSHYRSWAPLLGWLLSMRIGVPIYHFLKVTGFYPVIEMVIGRAT